METKLVKILDDDGNGYDVIYYQDLVVTAHFKTVANVEKKLSAIKHIEYLEGDVFLCGYPKCGNHWMSNLISYMQHPGSADETLSINIPLVDIFSVRELKQQPRPRLFATHYKFDRLPTQHIASKGKLILILRNPKDAAVSYFYHLKHRHVNNKQSWERYIKCYMEGKVINGSYVDYLNSWTDVLKSGHFHNILVVYYEDLVQDCFKQLKRIQTFLRLTNSDDRLKEIVNRCSIDKLRSDVNSGRLKALLTDDEGKSQIYRKGKVGDWKNHFTEAQSEEFDKLLDLKLKECPFHFRYDSTAASKL